MKKSIIIDADGCIFKHDSNGFAYNPNIELLPGTQEKFFEWLGKDYQIIILTGRRESDRELTVKQLNKHGIPYDILIMGARRGERIIINDTKPDGTITAKAYSITRNEGISNLDI